MAALLGRKVGMTQVFQEDGRLERVTVVEAGPCPVLAIREGGRTVGSGVVTEVVE